jgi:hypothetical protein
LRTVKVENGVHYLEPTEQEKEQALLKEAIREIQEREKQRDPKWNPRNPVK